MVRCAKKRQLANHETCLRPGDSNYRTEHEESRQEEIWAGQRVRSHLPRSKAEIQAISKDIRVEDCWIHTIIVTRHASGSIDALSRYPTDRYPHY